MNRPPALVCYICGREFGTKSLAFHLKACEKKWENEENLKPPKQRRPCPQPPPGLSQLLDKGNVTKNDIYKFNTKSFDSFVEEALVQCEYCSRRFNPSSLIPHQKACKTKPMIKKPFTNKGVLGKFSQPQEPIKATQGNYNLKQQMNKYGGSKEQSDLVACRRCGRTFMPDRIAKHQKVCKADPVQKPKPQVKYEKKPQPQKMKPKFAMEKKAKWKIQHQEFQNALKAMRQMKAIQAKGGKISDLPPPPPSNYDHYIECRYCGRKYAPDVAQRHIPKCANIINKPGGIKPSRIQDKYIAGTGSGGSKAFGTASNITPLKPNFATSNNKSTAGKVVGYNQVQKVEEPYSNPFGSNYKPASKSYKQPSYEKPSSSMKPNLKSSSRSNASKYW